jgi:hypothetical protein
MLDTERKPHANKGAPKAAAIRHRVEMRTVKPPRALPIPKGLPDVTSRIGLLDLGTRDCRYCSGDPLTADHSFCGQRVKPGSSWCPSHHAIVFGGRAA